MLNAAGLQSRAPLRAIQTVNAPPGDPILDADAFQALKCVPLIDFGGDFGLNKVAPRAQFYAGRSQRF
jgi:hypothetical protein